MKDLSRGSCRSLFSKECLPLVSQGQEAVCSAGECFICPASGPKAAQPGPTERNPNEGGGPRWLPLVPRLVHLQPSREAHPLLTFEGSTFGELFLLFPVWWPFSPFPIQETHQLFRAPR